MPDELFNKWLAPIIEAQGWPFSSISDDLQASDWKFNLGINHTLKQWTECEWELVEIPLIFANFKSFTLDTISDIISNAVKGIPTRTTDLIGGKTVFGHVQPSGTSLEPSRGLSWSMNLMVSSELLTASTGLRLSSMSVFPLNLKFQLG